MTTDCDFDVNGTPPYVSAALAVRQMQEMQTGVWVAWTHRPEVFGPHLLSEAAQANPEAFVARIVGPCHVIVDCRTAGAQDVVDEICKGGKSADVVVLYVDPKLGPVRTPSEWAWPDDDLSGQSLDFFVRSRR